ncbi:hypothetical protein HMPREF9104_00949, partial [Lentilactobacillus kisonensis F0435]
SQAVRNWNISLLTQKFLGLEFLGEVLICKFLPDAAVLKTVSEAKRLESGA